jgi:IS605 OrfB family transposase
MIKRYRKFHVPTMRRSSRVFLNHLNAGKAQTLVEFLRLCHDVTQYFVDLFWQRQDFSAVLADLATVHRACTRFKITTRLSQALAKQAKEIVRSSHEQGGSYPEVKKHVVTLYYHFVTIEKFNGKAFDWAIRLTGSGAPVMVIPCKSTSHLNRMLSNGWQMSKTIRLGLDRQKRLFVDFLLEKPRPPLKTEGQVVGMDNNYKTGLVFSDGQTVGAEAYAKIQTFSKRKKHTHATIASLMGKALKAIDWSHIKVLAVENLKHVKSNPRRSRVFNRRLSHWLYGLILARLRQDCEENGVCLVMKDPAYTSQTCSECGWCERRNRNGDRFCCLHCGYADQADHNAARNLERLGLAGVYGLRSLPNFTRVVTTTV